MEENKYIPKKIEYKFKRLNNYNVVNVDGIWGGATTHGKLFMELYSEAPFEIESVTHEVKDGQIGSEIERLPKTIDSDTAITQRLIHTAIVMSPDTAESIGQWMIDEAKKLKGDKK